MAIFFFHTTLFHLGHQLWLLLCKMNLSASLDKARIFKRPNQESRWLVPKSCPTETDSGAGPGVMRLVHHGVATATAFLNINTQSPSSFPSDHSEHSWTRKEEKNMWEINLEHVCVRFKWKGGTKGDGRVRNTRKIITRVDNVRNKVPVDCQDSAGCGEKEGSHDLTQEGCVGVSVGGQGGHQPNRGRCGRRKAEDHARPWEGWLSRLELSRGSPARTQKMTARAKCNDGRADPWEGPTCGDHTLLPRSGLQLSPRPCSRGCWALDTNPTLGAVSTFR